MHASNSNVGDLSSDLPRASGNAVSRDEHFPKIAFIQPTDEEAQQITFFLSNRDKVLNHEIPSLFSDEKKGLKPLFVHDPTPDSITDDDRIRAPDSQSNNTVTGNDYVSFGDEGTTVTVNSFGNIMQISRSLGYGHSGLFCLDTTEVCSPAFSQPRLEQLMQMSKSPESGIRLEKMSSFGERPDIMQQKPNLEFIFNRWPRFTSQPITHSDTQPSGGEDALCLQYFCHEGNVFQRYTFDHDPDAPSALNSCLLGIQRNFLIRTLDFVRDSTFNRAGPQDDDYVHLAGQKKLSYLWVHRISPANANDIGIDEEEYKKNDGPKAVAIVISVFINGKAQMLDRNSEDLYVDLIEETRKELKSPGHVNITVAYRLQILKNVQSWKKSIIPACALDSMRSVFSKAPNAFHRIRWSSNDQVDYIIGRNLEHILSVCSMPIPKNSTHTTMEDDPQKGEAVKDEHDMDSTSLALTCGDISGHRIVSSAAFFAFEFLIEVLKHLFEKSNEVNATISNLMKSFFTKRRFSDPEKRKRYIKDLKTQTRASTDLSSYISKLQERILKTLEAHLTWTAKAEKKRGYVLSQYWITGKEIGDWRTHRSFPPTSLTDVPFEVIKSHSLYKLYKMNKDLVRHFGDGDEQHFQVLKDFDKQKLLRSRIEAYIRPWLQKLYESDKRHKYAFPREKPDKSKTYRLADHVWICRAIKCVEELQMEELLDIECGKQYLEYPLLDAKGISYRANGQAPKEQQRTIRSKELHRVVLKRFTTRNPQSQQQMLATSRTPSESRFLFHGTDTALFYAMDSGFFDREKKTNRNRTNWTNKISVWKETVEAQTEHEETQTLDWENPLWYALAFVISSTRRRFNKASADQMLHVTAKILFGLSSTSGLFPGRLNEKREAIVFEHDLERDKYWHTTFEIPYALWKYGREYVEISPEHDESDQVKGPQQDMIQAKNYGQLQQPMTKRMEFSTFNGLIDKSRFVEVSDDWLREAPSFLNFDSSTSFDDMWYYKMMQNLGRDYGRIIHKALENHNDDLPEKQEAPGTGVVFDVPKNYPNQLKDRSGMDSREQLQTNAEIKEVLKDERTTQIAKKRLVWLPKADKETALTCWLASSTRTEQDNLSAFFDKHASYEKHFYDGTSAIWNEWVTELHLSYFRRAEWNDTKEEGQKRKDTIPDLSFITVNARVADVGKMTESAKIVRSNMSFRFVGDFFDRYWTCYFLEFDPAGNQSKPKDTLKSRLSDLGFEGHAKAKKPWQQRKVLELLLFDYILGKIHTSTKGLLDWIRDVVIEKDNKLRVDGIDTVSILEMPFGVRATEPLNPLAEALQAGVQSFVKTGSDGYSSIVERWRFFEQVLQAIEEDLSRNLQTVSFWNSREQDREPERPRWTLKDEMSYRQVINNLQVLNHRKIRDLESLRTAIGTFRASLTGQLDTMRSDLEYQGSENTGLFTYVTVVFLPLGFATSILSMSGPPDRSTLVSMITLSLVAMAITLFALANAKNTGKKIVRPVLESFRAINNLFLDPPVNLLLTLMGLLLRPLRILENIFSVLQILLKDICLFLSNTLLLLGMMLRFAILFGFRLFVSLPLSRYLHPKDHTEEKTPSTSEKDQSSQTANDSSQIPFYSFEKAFEPIQRMSRSIEKRLAKEGNRDPLKLAEERFRKREKEKQREKERQRETKEREKKERDIESGGEMLGQIESDATESQQRG